MLFKMKMDFHKPDDLMEMLKSINPDKFVGYMKELGEIAEITGDYSQDVYNLCNNGVAYILKEVKAIYLYDLNVVEGYFDSNDHTWIEVGDYRIDITLAQFYPKSPKIAITMIGNGRYRPTKTYSVQEWGKEVSRGLE